MSTSHLHLSKAIEQLLHELETKQSGQIDKRLCQEVRNALGIAEKDRSFVAAKTGFVLETILKSVYQQQFPNKSLPTLDAMIGDLHKAKVLPLSLTRDADYIRLKRNDASHGKDSEQTFLSAREAEQLILITLNFVEWYFKSYTHRDMPDVGIIGSTSSELAPNPYRGLASFRIQDSELFFGREQETEELLNLRHKSFVTIAGASGSGKSSLAFAGLAAGLQQQGWAILTCRPQIQPFYELAKTLAEALYPDSLERGEKVNIIKQKLAEQKLDLNDLLEQIRGDRPGVLLLIDQFEELFTQTTDTQIIRSYCHVLAQAVHENPGRALYTITLRADFFGQALQDPTLAELLDRYPKKMLGPIADLRPAIEKPAKAAGVVFENLLVERLLRDLQQSEQQNNNAPLVSLPLLQFTLARLWDAQESRQITHRSYGELESVHQALSHRAEAICETLDADDQARMRRILVQLIHPGQGTEDTRQLAYREQIADSDWSFVDLLAKERLVVTNRDETSGKETVEIVHEALLRHWQRLRSWIDEDREFRLWQDKLRQYLHDWHSNGEDDEALLSGPRLAEAQANLDLHQDRLAIVEAQFIETSTAYAEQEQEEERQRQQEINEALIAKAQASRRLAKRSLVFVVIACSLIAGTGWQWWVALQKQQMLEKAHEEINDHKAKLDQQISYLIPLAKKKLHDKKLKYSDEIVNNNLLIMLLITDTESMNDNERQEWIEILQSTGIKYQDNLFKILETEKNKLESLEEGYKKRIELDQLLEWFFSKLKKSSKNGYVIARKDDISQLLEYFEGKPSDDDFIKLVQIGEGIIKNSLKSDLNSKVLGFEWLARVYSKNPTKYNLIKSANYSQEVISILNNEHIKNPTDDKLRKKLSTALGRLSFELLHIEAFYESLQASTRAIDLEPTQTWIKGNQAHALLFLGRTDEALQIYSKYKDDKAFENKTFKEATIEDFDIFQKLGLPEDKMQIVRKLYEK